MTQSLSAQPEQKLFTVSEYQALFEHGILNPSERYELIEGRIYEKMTQNPPHRIACAMLLQVLSAALRPGWFLAMQTPIVGANVTPGSFPEPDGAVVRGKPQDYPQDGWSLRDAALIIEVSDSSLSFDRRDKKQAYARAGVPVYWIVNLVACQVEVYTTPIDQPQPTYQVEAIYRPGQIVPLILDGQEVAQIPTTDLLP